MRSCSNRVIRIVIAAGLMTGVASTASAQQPPGDEATRHWRVTFYGGVGTGGTPSGGSGFLPPPGESFVPAPFAPETRRVSTWWLGDGSALLNEVLRQLTPPGPPGTPPVGAITPVDSLVTSGVVERRPGLVIGGRATRTLTRHLDLEVGVDIGMQKLSLTSDATNALHSIRATFTSAFDALFTRANRPDRSVTASLTTPAGSPRQSAVTGTVIYNFRPQEDVQPYVLAGGGMLMSSGSVEYTLVGRYTFTTGPLLTGETDTLHVVTDWSNSPMAVFGAGIRRAVSERTGFSVEVRAAVSNPDPRTHITTTPSHDPAAGGGFGATIAVTTPSLAIVGPNSMGFDSSLSAPPLTDFTTFDGTGRLTTVAFTFGYFISF